MAITLEGGCRVTDMRESEPVRQGTLSVWPQVGRAVGAQTISLRVLEFAPGLSPGICNEACDEILYVLGWDRGRCGVPGGAAPLACHPARTNWDRGRPARTNVRDNQAENDDSTATIFLGGSRYEVAPATGIYLRPNEVLTVNNPGPEPLVLISSQCPEPIDSTPIITAPATSPTSAPSGDRSPIVRLADRRAIPTADRWYRVLVDEEIGSTQVTQFVGSIPPGRAPDHFHNYEEVLFILRGQGRMWAGASNTSIAPGSCVYLPKGQVHCVENTGDQDLRLLGVFYPADSPSVRYEVR
jgi:mannose-6-phosphate isomerase-like protein (cupin superfamily)